MTSPVTELEGNLQAMLNLKPPGVSGSRINSATSLCVDNVQSESVLVQKMFTHFKKAPGTHKLGALYVVDSVTRRWLEHAKSEGQAISSAAKDGTYAAGVHRVTELMPVLMNDILASAPETQKEKIKKLIDIWDKGQTFPSEMIKSFREKLAAPPPNESTTPTNTPPPELLASLGRKPSPKPDPKPEIPNSSAIMQALANIARQNTTSTPSNSAATSSLQPHLASVPTTVPVPTPDANLGTAVGLYGVPPPQPAATAALGYPSTVPPVNLPSIPFSLSQQMPTHPPAGVATNNFLGALGALSGMPSSTVPNPMAHNPIMDPNQQKQLLLLQTLMSQGVPIETITSVLQTMSAGSASVGTPNVGQMPFPGPVSHGSWPTAGPTESRDRISGDGLRSPRYRGRSRSRSPGRGWDSDRYGEYGTGSPGRGGRERDSRRGDYRQRSPPGRRGRSPSPARPVARGEKNVEYDRSLPAGHIKVYSRTLFVGGVTCPDAELRAIFSRFGEVQTCIVNREKRHAFVKMVTRKDAVSAKDGMENSRHSEYQLRTRWGVGFGPRDCSDYATGVSIIPIHKLTEADRKWMLTAEFGGSGGKPIEHGLVVEEPDIEIGAGVSSKAISRRMQTDKSGTLGPKSTRNKDDPEEQDIGDDGRYRRGRDSRRDDGPVRNSPSTPTLGFPFAFGNLQGGMPAYAANYNFSGMDGNQPS